MSKAHGKNLYFKLGTTALTGQVNNVAAPYGAPTVDVSCGGDDDEVHVGGISGGSWTLSGFFDSTTHAALRAMIGTSQVFEYGPVGNTVGAVKESGTCIVKDVDVSGGTTSAVALNITLQISGGVTTGTFSA